MATFSNITLTVGTWCVKKGEKEGEVTLESFKGKKTH